MTTGMADRKGFVKGQELNAGRRPSGPEQRRASTQVTKVATGAVYVPGLPSDLDAYPVYRFRVRDGTEEDAKLLRLEVRAASTLRASSWLEKLGSIDEASVRWLVNHSPGKAKRLTERFGEHTLGLMYKWCAAGIVVFEVEPPHEPGATHGALVAWRLSDAVQAHADETAQRSEDQRAALATQAKQLGSRLQAFPETQLLARILIDPLDPTFLEHTVTVARSIVNGPRPFLPAPEGLSISNDTTAASFVLQRLSRGRVKDYAVDQEVIERGGQATVAGATHKGTGQRVAFKRVRIRDEDSTARMGREIEAGRLFGGHPHIMPVLDADPACHWFVMPLASGTARTYADQLMQPDRLRRMLIAVCEALRVPHQQGWIHRDLKPENLLLLHDRWTVADWGLGRRPRGETTQPGRTRTGSGYGTVGFAAPELSLDAHQVGPPADIYSIGQIIGAILTGRSPQANIALIPPSGPWTALVEYTTLHDPSARPQTVDDLLDLIDAAH
ncbi:serine/threonine-protein kinase [Micromonospora chaiyaphumensis]|uniref:serine/threonine-protein kinase n=1 Tax=Micromonospora chaiyaphumensis TaxID=307119 RepID=UPI0011131C87|nr:serine/threonine-protein kinase [Micromonospora chaiyaphumensis]